MNNANKILQARLIAAINECASFINNQCQRDEVSTDKVAGFLTKMQDKNEAAMRKADKVSHI